MNQEGIDLVKFLVISNLVHILKLLDLFVFKGFFSYV